MDPESADESWDVHCCRNEYITPKCANLGEFRFCKLGTLIFSWKTSAEIGELLEDEPEVPLRRSYQVGDCTLLVGQEHLPGSRPGMPLICANGEPATKCDLTFSPEGFLLGPDGTSVLGWSEELLKKDCLLLDLQGRPLIGKDHRPIMKRRLEKNWARKTLWWGQDAPVSGEHVMSSTRDVTPFDVLKLYGNLHAPVGMARGSEPSELNEKP